MDCSSFVRQHLGKLPHAGAGTASCSISALQWQTLDRVLVSHRPLDILTVSAGEMVKVPQPRNLHDVRDLMRRGVSTVIRAGELHDPGLATLARSFEQVLPGEVHVQIYATPAGTNSYGWHFDFEDVFVVQTAGTKDYYFRQNTVACDRRLGEPLDFTLFRDETTPLFSSRLQPGDWLYIPARWWHLVKCVEDSLSISIGVMSLEAVRSAVRIPVGWSGVQHQRNVHGDSDS
jgi:50S ribosomal protein L16 3-hydroxylase